MAALDPIDPRLQMINDALAGQTEARAEVDRLKAEEETQSGVVRSLTRRLAEEEGALDRLRQQRETAEQKVAGLAHQRQVLDDLIASFAAGATAPAAVPTAVVSTETHVGEPAEEGERLAPPVTAPPTSARAPTQQPTTLQRFKGLLDRARQALQED